MCTYMCVQSTSMYVCVNPSKMLCLVGKNTWFNWLYAPWHQSSQASLNWVCWATSTLLIPTWWNPFPFKVVRVGVQDCSSCPVLAANQTGRVDWWELAGCVGFPNLPDQRAEPGSGWTPAKLNHILQAHVVDNALSTFGCVEWESDLCRGVMCARCYPFDMPKHKFHVMNPKVMYIHSILLHCTHIYKHCI